jgi:hypothetical protein
MNPSPAGTGGLLKMRLQAFNLSRTRMGEPRMNFRKFILGKLLSSLIFIPEQIEVGLLE